MRKKCSDGVVDNGRGKTRFITFRLLKFFLLPFLSGTLWLEFAQLRSETRGRVIFLLLRAAAL